MADLRRNSAMMARETPAGGTRSDRSRLRSHGYRTELNALSGHRGRARTSVKLAIA